MATLPLNPSSQILLSFTFKCQLHGLIIKQNTKIHQGPPGTGKTMVAREIARKSAKQHIQIQYMSEAERSALNALLYRTGDQSRDIVLVLATNRPGYLDSAVTDRIDEVIEFPLQIVEAVLGKLYECFGK